MRNGLAALHLPGGMSTSSHNLFADFYIPCLSNSVLFRRASGYFSSAILSLAPLAYSDFFAAGGKVQLISSTQLTETDSLALTQPSQTPEEELEQLFTRLASASQSSNSIQSLLTRLFASLLSAGQLEMKFALPKSGKGIYHDKFGIFLDGENNRVSFIGSANETAMAWAGNLNHEQIEIFSSLRTEDLDRIKHHEEGFERLWSNRASAINTVSVEDFDVDLLKQIPAEPVDSLLQEIRKELSHETWSGDVKSNLQLRGYQEQALASWADAGNKGVICFATGGGKTKTAISAISDWVSSNRVALVLVPSSLLLEQWRKELESWIPGANILSCGGPSPKSAWSKSLHRFSQPSIEKPRIIVSTYSTASTGDFLDLLVDGEHLLVVADEVHRFGSADTRTIGNQLRSGGQLGLSATPDRAGDEAGTAAIRGYFGEDVKPFYRLNDAIHDGYLVKYDYRFLRVKLLEEEMAEWDKLTSAISTELARNDGELTDRLKKLAIRRARISKRARNKARVAAQTVKENFVAGDRWLIYCEGADHLAEVAEEVLNVGLGVAIMEYHSQNSDEHKRVIDFFERQGGVVLAIKCLDEGIDIPIINKAIILSSSTNPREYIQRRGRVLRTHPSKNSAQVWDLLTCTPDGRAISRTEVVRAEEFASGSRNRAVKLELKSLQEQFSERDDFGSDENSIEEVGG